MARPRWSGESSPRTSCQVYRYICQHTDNDELISEGGVGVNEGVGESGWIVEKDKPEYDEIFNRLEISGGKVTGE